MLEEGHITREEADAALGEPLVLRPKKAESLWAGPYFTEHIRRYVEGKYGGDLLYKGGLHIYTTMDVDMQIIANDAVDFGLRAHDKRHGYRGATATLSSEKGFERFKEKALKELKKRPLEAGRIYAAVVTSIEKKPFALHVALGDYKGIVAKSDMKWARLFNPTKSADGGEKVKLKDVFGVGDVIDVLVKSIPDDPTRPIPMRLEQTPVAQAALLAMEPSSGYVLAMIGGSNFSTSQYNRAIQSRRQPGSAFKPIIYTAALDNDYTPASIVIDSPLIFKERVKGVETLEDGTVVTDVLKKTWKPDNYSGKFRGRTTVRTALTKSMNVVTIKILRDIGVRRAIKYARKLGIESPLARDLSLALGSSGISLLELTRAYATLANLGTRSTPIFITRIIDRNGEILEENLPVLEETIAPETAFITTSLLQGVVQNGTGWRAKALKRPVAGKTGTTNNLIDAWFMGFSPELAAGVWVGYDSEIALGRNETGSKTASPIWVRFMKGALKGKPKTNFPIPPGIEFAKIDPETGLLAGPETKKPIFEVFKAGTAPTRPETGVDVEKDTGELDFFQLDEEESNAAETPLDVNELDDDENMI
jgi:penicillin-binding protein 1A